MVSKVFPSKNHLSVFIQTQFYHSIITVFFTVDKSFSKIRVC